MFCVQIHIHSWDQMDIKNQSFFSNLPTLQYCTFAKTMVTLCRNRLILCVLIALVVYEYLCQDLELTTETLRVLTSSSSPSSDTAHLRHHWDNDNQASSWCPHAQCHDSELCHPCHRRFLIVLATARSASTTLTWMLDALPGVRMSGENNDLLKRVHDLMEETVQNPFVVKGTNKKVAWGHNEFPKQAFSCVAQQMVETMNPPPRTRNRKNQHPHPRNETDTIIGFKTVRFQENVDTAALPELAKFLKEYFPCARFVMNIRSNTEEQATSWHTNFHGSKTIEEVSDHLNEETEKIKYLHELLKDRSVLLDSSTWIPNLTTLNQAVEWLGFHRTCHFPYVLEFNTQKKLFGSKMASGTTKLEMNPNCRYEPAGRKNT
jgi:hypothetical protein